VSGRESERTDRGAATARSGSNLRARQPDRKGRGNLSGGTAESNLRYQTLRFAARSAQLRHRRRNRQRVGRRLRDARSDIIEWQSPVAHSGESCQRVDDGGQMIGAAALPTPTGASGHGTMWTSIATGASDSLFIARHRPTSLRGPLDQSFVRQARTPCPAVWSPLIGQRGLLGRYGPFLSISP
jgi:hypothetical protein